MSGPLINSQQKQVLDLQIQLKYAIFQLTKPAKARFERTPQTGGLLFCRVEK